MRNGIEERVSQIVSGTGRVRQGRIYGLGNMYNTHVHVKVAKVEMHEVLLDGCRRAETSSLSQSILPLFLHGNLNGRKRKKTKERSDGGRITLTFKSSADPRTFNPFAS